MHNCLAFDGRGRAGDQTTCPDCAAFLGEQLAAAVLAYDKSLTEWAQSPTVKAPLDERYQTTLRLAQGVVG